MKRVLHVPEARIFLFAFPLHFFWELLQSPAYTFNSAPMAGFWPCLLYCTSVDVLITLGIFWVIALAFKNRYWFGKPSAPQIAFFLSLSVLSSVIAEYINVFVQQDWAYAPAMPLIFGIGLLPILQWLVIPAILLIFI